MREVQVEPTNQICNMKSWESRISSQSAGNNADGRDFVAWTRTCPGFTSHNGPVQDRVWFRRLRFHYWVVLTLPTLSESLAESVMVLAISAGRLSPTVGNVFRMVKVLRNTSKRGGRHEWHLLKLLWVTIFSHIFSGNGPGFGE